MLLLAAAGGVLQPRRLEPPRRKRRHRLDGARPPRRGRKLPAGLPALAHRDGPRLRRRMAVVRRRAPVTAPAEPAVSARTLSRRPPARAASRARSWARVPKQCGWYERQPPHGALARGGWRPYASHSQVRAPRGAPQLLPGGGGHERASSGDSPAARTSLPERPRHAARPRRGRSRRRPLADGCNRKCRRLDCADHRPRGVSATSEADRAGVDDSSRHAVTALKCDVPVVQDMSCWSYSLAGRERDDSRE